MSSITRAPLERKRGTVAAVISAAFAVQACERVAQIEARWLLPLPEGPVSRQTVSGQFGQASISA